MSLCVRWHVPEDADLVIVEYNINDGGADKVRWGQCMHHMQPLGWVGGGAGAGQPASLLRGWTVPGMPGPCLGVCVLLIGCWGLLPPSHTTQLL